LKKSKSATETKTLESFSSLEKCKLSKSFAYRVGAIEALKPLEFIPNSPVSRKDGNRSRSSGRNWDVLNEISFSAVGGVEMEDLLMDPDWETPHQVENSDNETQALTDRFRAYARAINLESGDDQDKDSIMGKNQLQNAGMRPRIQFGSEAEDNDGYMSPEMSGKSNGMNLN